MKEISVGTYGTQGIAQIVRLHCEPIILIGHFDSRPEAKLKRWSKTASL